MMAATRSKKRETGKPPEETRRDPSKFQEELTKIFQKNKKRDEPVRRGRSPEQGETLDEAVEELPFAEVQPLPSVARKPAPVDKSEKLFDIPKFTEESGYKNRAPLQLDERAKDLIQETLKNTICITTEDLLNVSEPMRQELKKLLVKKRQEKKTVGLIVESDSVPEGGIEDELQEETISVESLPEAICEILTEDTNGMAKGSMVVTDPVVQYFNTMAPGEKPKSVVVAAESNALRTVYPLINGVGEVESLLDGGSQIVSMSKHVANKLQIPWDPDITVHMESANRALEQTLGLAKNVPFVFGHITVYLQVHIIEKVAYKVLLGRPFDTITESEVKNSRDGSQSLTITDLNTGERCNMTTHERGKSPTMIMRPAKQDFLSNSRN